MNDNGRLPSRKRVAMIQVSSSPNAVGAAAKSGQVLVRTHVLKYAGFSRILGGMSGDLKFKESQILNS